MNPVTLKIRSPPCPQNVRNLSANYFHNRKFLFQIRGFGMPAGQANMSGSPPIIVGSSSGNHPLHPVGIYNLEIGQMTYHFQTSTICPESAGQAIAPGSYRPRPFRKMPGPARYSSIIF